MPGCGVQVSGGGSFDAVVVEVGTGGVAPGPPVVPGVEVGVVVLVSVWEGVVVAPGCPGCVGFVPGFCVPGLVLVPCEP